jgi:hypothetical protein
MKTQKLSQIRPDKGGDILTEENEGFLEDDVGLQARFAGYWRALVAGESGVAATALPPQSKTLAGWRGVPSGWIAIGNLKSQI